MEECSFKRNEVKHRNTLDDVTFQTFGPFVKCKNECVYLISNEGTLVAIRAITRVKMCSCVDIARP
jgi:hypothetical protein